MKLFRNNFLDIIKILFKIALNIPKLFYIKLKIYFSIYKKPKTTIKNNVHIKFLAFMVLL